MPDQNSHPSMGGENAEDYIIPRGLPASRVKIFKAVLEAHRRRQIENLRTTNSVYFDFLMLRFGLYPDQPRMYRTLEEIATILGQKHSLRRLEQIEQEALLALDIHESDAPAPKKLQHRKKENPWFSPKFFSLAVRVVSAYYQLADGEIVGIRGKNRRLLLPRQVLIYLLYEDYGWIFSEIGKMFGHKDHTSALNAHKRVIEKMHRDQKILEDLAIIRAKLQEELKKLNP